MSILPQFKIPSKIPVFLLILIVLMATGIVVIFKTKINPKNKIESLQESTSGTKQTQNDISSQPKNATPSATTTPAPTSTLSNLGSRPNLQDSTQNQLATASKANFVPSFSVSLDNPQPSASSAVNLELGSKSGDWLGISIRISIPPFWNLTPGNQLAQDAIVGQGTIDAQLNGQASKVSFITYNQADTQGHLARWLLKFTDERYGEKILIVDGNNSSGYALILENPISIALSSPVLIKFKILSNTISNPQSAGNYQWKVEYVFTDGIVEAKREVGIK